MSRAVSSRSFPAVTLLLAALLGGCASKPSYVVLQRDADGALGRIVVTSPKGEQVLTETFQGVKLDGKSPPYFVMQEQLKRDFGAAMAALPTPPAESYVVLLRDPDGALGKVVVANRQGEQVLSESLKGVNLDGSSPPYPVTQDQLRRDFGAALSAVPQGPLSFDDRKIEFQFGGPILTEASEEVLKQVAAELVQHASKRSLDILVIGHTDSVGDAEANFKLGLRRATSVADILRNALGKQGFTNIPVRADSHGKSRPKFDPGDDPRNRRVEIIVR